MNGNGTIPGDYDDVMAGMATIPSRAEQLPDAVRSIAPQVDVLGVYFGAGYSDVEIKIEDGFTGRPWDLVAEICKDCDTRLQTRICDDRPEDDPGDAAKFWWAPMWDGFYLSVDDDLVYSDTFVRRHLLSWARYEEPVAVSLHGSRLTSQPTSSYYHDGRETYHFRRMLPEDREVHIAATLGCLYHTGQVAFSVEDCEPMSQMSDIWFSLACKEQGAARIVRAHRGEDRGGTRQNREVDLSDAIYTEHHQDDDRQTEVINANQPWELLGVTSR